MGHVNDKGVIKFELRDEEREFLVIFDAHENKIRITNKISRPKAARILYNYLQLTDMGNLQGFRRTFCHAYQRYDSKNELMLDFEKGVFWVEKLNNIGLWISRIQMFGQPEEVERLGKVNFTKELVERFNNMYNGMIEPETVLVATALMRITPDDIRLAQEVFGFGEREALRQLAEWDGSHDKIMQWYTYLTQNKHFEEINNFRTMFLDYNKKIDELKEEHLYPKNFFESYALLKIRHRAKQDEVKNVGFAQAQNKYALRFEDENYTVFVPQTIADVHDEATQQRHCVASYTDHVIRGELFLVFIRKKTNPKKSYITVELNTRLDVRQTSLFANDGIRDQQDRAFLDRYQQYLRTLR